MANPCDFWHTSVQVSFVSHPHCLPLKHCLSLSLSLSSYSHTSHSLSCITILLQNIFYKFLSVSLSLSRFWRSLVTTYEASQSKVAAGTPDPTPPPQDSMPRLHLKDTSTGPADAARLYDVVLRSHFCSNNSGTTLLWTSV